MDEHNTTGQQENLLLKGAMQLELSDDGNSCFNAVITALHQTYPGATKISDLQQLRKAVATYMELQLTQFEQQKLKITRILEQHKLTINNELHIVDKNGTHVGYDLERYLLQDHSDQLTDLRSIKELVDKINNDNGTEVYLGRLRCDGTPGSNIELEIIASVLQCQIVV
ncbi:MAG: hypothetical protein COB50_04580, partial [Thiotrichales bacterium]